MKGEEVKELIVKKLREGKDYPEINEEINTLKKSQIVFKAQKSEIQMLKEKIEKLEKENNDLKNKNFKLNFQMGANKQKKKEELKENGDGDLKNLKRILLVLNQTEIPITASTLVEEVCIGSQNAKKIYPLLGFLLSYNLVKTETDKRGFERYFIERTERRYKIE